MTTVLVTAFGLVLPAAAAIVVIALRARASVDGRIRQLADGLGYTTELASSLEPDDILDRTLDATVALPEVDAALIIVNDENGTRRTRAVGLSEDEVERAVLQMPVNPNLRAMEVVYRYRMDEVDEVSNLPRSAVTVGMRANGELVGSLAAITRSTSSRFSEELVDSLDGLARRAGPALANARRFNEARELAELDSLTGLHNRRCFHEFLAREIVRARRYERRLSLIVFDLDDFKRINDRIGHLGGDSVLVEVADRVRSVVRATDLGCRVGGDEFAIILPESTRDDAELLADRIARAIGAQAIEKAGILKISAGVSELRHDDTAPIMFERADRALYSAKNAGKARTIAN